jgi:hypothetical protein
MKGKRKMKIVGPDRMAPANTARRAMLARRRRRFDPDVRRWHQWCHDLDTLLHELVKNPALADVEPAILVARAEAFADALEAMQNRRRPLSVSAELDF